MGMPFWISCANDHNDTQPQMCRFCVPSCMFNWNPRERSCTTTNLHNALHTHVTAFHDHWLRRPRRTICKWRIESDQEQITGIHDVLMMLVSMECHCLEQAVISQTYRYQGLYSLSGQTSYRQISWSLEAARLDVAMVVSLWNLTGTSAAALPRYLPQYRAIGKV